MKVISTNHKYLVLLSSLVIFLMLSPLTLNTMSGKITYTSLFLLVMISISINIKSRPFAYWVLPMLGVINIIFGLFDYNPLFLMLSNVSALLFFLCAIFLFGKNIFTDKQYKADPIYGSICLYLLIGVTYATIYMLVDSINPQSLLILETGKYVQHKIDFYYFSFVTLTTVGFGDIVANNDFSKVVTMLESTTGLFYLGILVASLTSVNKTS